VKSMKQLCLDEVEAAAAHKVRSMNQKMLREESTPRAAKALLSTQEMRESRLSFYKPDRT